MKCLEELGQTLLTINENISNIKTSGFSNKDDIAQLFENLKNNKGNINSKKLYNSNDLKDLENKLFEFFEDKRINLNINEDEYILLSKFLYDFKILSNRTISICEYSSIKLKDTFLSRWIKKDNIERIFDKLEQSQKQDDICNNLIYSYLNNFHNYSEDFINALRDYTRGKIEISAVYFKPPKTVKDAIEKTKRGMDCWLEKKFWNTKFVAYVWAELFCSPIPHRNKSIDDMDINDDFYKRLDKDDQKYVLIRAISNSTEYFANDFSMTIKDKITRIDQYINDIISKYINLHDMLSDEFWNFQTEISTFNETYRNIAKGKVTTLLEKADDQIEEL